MSFFFQAEDGIRDLVRSRGRGDVYKRQDRDHPLQEQPPDPVDFVDPPPGLLLLAWGLMFLLSLIHI